MISQIQQYQDQIKNNIFSQFKPNIEVFDAAGVIKFGEILKKSFELGEITQQDFEKGLKDLTKLQKKIITNKQGHQQTVYIRVHEDKSEHHFKHDDKVKFEHKGETKYGKIKGLKHHEKFDPYGTAVIHDKDGNKYSKSLRAIEHHGTDVGQVVGADKNGKEVLMKPTTEPKKETNKEQKDFSKFLDEVPLTEDFIKYADKEMFDEGSGWKHKKEDFKNKKILIEGYCDLFAIYVKTKYPENVEIESAVYGMGIDHRYLKYKGKYFDGLDTQGVDNVLDLKYFKNMSKENLKKVKIEDYDMKRMPHNAPIDSKKKILLGSGVQGDVYDLGDGRVQKVFKNKKDKTIKEYKKLINKDSKHFVKVESVDLENGTVIMEKLTPLKEADYDVYARRMFDLGCDEFCVLEDREWSENRVMQEVKSPKERKKLMEFMDFIEAVNKSGEELGINANDFHAKNFGKDKNGNIKMFDFDKVGED